MQSYGQLQGLPEGVIKLGWVYIIHLRHIINSLWIASLMQSNRRLPTHAMAVKQHGATIPCLLWWLPELGEPSNGDSQPEQGILGPRPIHQQARDQLEMSTLHNCDV